MTTITTAAARDWLAAGIAETWGWAGREPAPGAPASGPTRASCSPWSRIDGLPHAITRVLPPGHISVTAVESEVAWMQALGADGVVRVPRVLETLTGTAVGVLESPRRARWTAVSVAYEPELATPPAAAGRRWPRLRTLGALAARLHAHARAWQAPTLVPPSHGRARPSSPVRRPGSAGRTIGLSTTALNVLGTAQEEALDVVSWAGEASGLVHGDLREAMAGDLLRSFECRWTWWEQDLAGSMSGLEAEIGAPSLAAAWLAGYAQGDGAPLDLRLAGALVMLHRLALLAADPELADGTLDVATRFLRSPTWLVD